MKAGVSVIIPAFGNNDMLLQSLDTWAKQTVKPDQIVVVDDGSDPPLTVPKGIELVRIERDMQHRGSSAAKNLGASHAIGNYLVFADDTMLVVPETVESLLDTFADFAKSGKWAVLLNVTRIGLDRRYTPEETKDMRAFLRQARTDLGVAAFESLGDSRFTYEQCVGAIPASVFWGVGGYDDKGLPSWGYNNHDLTLRVAQKGGHVTSWIRRSGSSYKLICFHNWHDAPANQDVAKAEFKAKWGREWDREMLTEVRNGKLAG